KIPEYRDCPYKIGTSGHPTYSQDYRQRGSWKESDLPPLPSETYLLYEIKWSNSKRPWQSCCHSTHTEHAEIHFIEDVFQEQRSDPSVHCSITWYMSWSPCADCCRAIRDFLKEQPNVNLVIYVARIYWHKEENNRQGLRSLVNIGVRDGIFISSDYGYCWRTFVAHQNGEEDDYCPLVRSRWKIQPKEFRAIFDPSAFPKVTYLLYEIKWGSSNKFWRKWCPNTPTHHAEINCLENDFKAIHHRPSVRCSIIWFLSWSPCGLCCRLIVHFLRAHPKVTLQIYIGRLFRHRDERNRQGLRDLVSSGVNVHIMSLPGSIHNQTLPYWPNIDSFLGKCGRRRDQWVGSNISLLPAERVES
uniref:C->U-editing enzyme APOBEC-1 n=1 Tax=Chelydra serpentina TaxID=8475 RepID=A0A8C3TJ69_CHESE